MTAPILFIHYGDSPYLRYTLEAAALFNPGKEVLLLGDASNRTYADRAGASFHPLADLDGGEKVGRFERDFRFIAGPRHGKEFWTRFVFKRWFLIDRFLRERGVDRFWTFDSDTLVLSDLGRYEARYAGYDCTEQCHGICMNGLVSREAVEGYTDKMLELFGREDYLERQRRIVEEHPTWAFTEMRAYATYKEEEGLRTMHLGSIVDGETFIDCICDAEGHNAIWESYDEPIGGQTVIRLYFADDGTVGGRHLPTGEFVRFAAINMSWVPLYFFERVLDHARQGSGRDRPGGRPGADGLRPMSPEEGLKWRWIRRGRRVRDRVRSRLGS